ncbi:MAG: Fe-S protein assembly co-chaperone HscB [Chitinophagaceae bacterium]|nr:Fe-S protein assembly co-chaperone HscB [Chitinophagaceae bacterium]
MYIELQRKYHPDYFTLSGDEEQAETLDKTAAINQAFKILKNEEETIKYILQLKGLLQEEEKYDLQPAFLMEMMDLNESLMEESQNVSIEKINKIEKEIYDKVGNIIQNYNDEEVKDTDLLKLKEYYFKKKYLQRILDRIDG